MSATAAAVGSSNKRLELQLHSRSLQHESSSGSDSSCSAHLSSHLQQLQSSSIASTGTDNTCHNTIKKEDYMLATWRDKILSSADRRL